MTGQERSLDASKLGALEAELEEACMTYDVWRAAVLCEQVAAIREARRPQPVRLGVAAVRMSSSRRLGWRTVSPAAL